jgi:hypothetical protein
MGMCRSNPNHPGNARSPEPDELISLPARAHNKELAVRPASLSIFNEVKSASGPAEV